MGKWLAVSVLLAGCLSASSRLPFADTKAAVAEAEGGGPATCTDGTPVFQVTTRANGTIYQLWLSKSRFVAAEYPNDSEWPTVVYWGTLGPNGELMVNKTISFDPKSEASPCDWLVMV